MHRIGCRPRVRYVAGLPLNQHALERSNLVELNSEHCNSKCFGADRYDIVRESRLMEAIAPPCGVDT